MRRYHEIPRRGARSRRLALAIGVFDGLHLGHQAVLKATVKEAEGRGWIAAALTFDPAPEVALGLAVPPRLGHPDEQAEVMAGLGLAELYRVPFTAALGRLSPERFASDILSCALRCGAVVVGRGFRFGAAAAGTVESLEALGRDLGFRVREVEPRFRLGAVVSSTRIRAQVQAGRMRRAAELLGRPWLYRGLVVRGRRLGRTLGFPTANLEGPQGVLPPRGVWVGRCRIISVRGASRWWGFAGNLGLRPTLKPVQGEALKATVELHLLDFAGKIPLEGRTLEAEFLQRLRPEKKFPSLEALSQGIAKDVSAAKAFLKAH